MISGRLLRKLGRNLLTVTALAVSFAMVLSLVSVSNGLRETSRERLEDSPRDIVISSIGLEPTIENTHDISYLLSSDSYNFSGIMPMLTVIGRLAIPPQEEAFLFTPESAISPDIGQMEKVEIGMVGLIPELAEDLIFDDSLIIRSERIGLDGWFEEEGDPYYTSRENWTHELLLDENILSETGLQEGDIVYSIGPDGKARSSFKVTGSLRSSIIGSGLAGELVSGMGMVHLSELQKITDNDLRSTPTGNITDLSNAIYIDLRNDRKDAGSQREIMMHLEGLFPGLKVTTKESRLYRIEEEVIVLQVFSYGVGSTTLVIGTLFLASIMILDVEDRRMEIAVMRAIGISKRTIYIQIWKDSLILSSFAILTGLVMAYFGSGFFDNRLKYIYGVDIRFSILTPELIVLSTLFLLFFVTVFSVLPGLRISSIDPKTCLSGYANR